MTSANDQGQAKHSPVALVQCTVLRVCVCVCVFSCVIIVDGGEICNLRGMGGQPLMFPMSYVIGLPAV